jgi:hypothetical protein
MRFRFLALALVTVVVIGVVSGCGGGGGGGDGGSPVAAQAPSVSASTIAQFIQGSWRREGTEVSGNMVFTSHTIVFEAKKITDSIVGYMTTDSGDVPVYGSVVGEYIVSDSRIDYQKGVMNLFNKNTNQAIISNTAVDSTYDTVTSIDSAWLKMVSSDGKASSMYRQ